MNTEERAQARLYAAQAACTVAAAAHSAAAREVDEAFTALRVIQDSEIEEATRNLG